jgi:hypothetical protein
MTLRNIHILLKYLSRVTARGHDEEEEFFEALTALRKYAEKLVTDEHRAA